LEKLISELSKNKEKYEFAEIIWPVQGQIVSQFGEVRDLEYGTRLVNNGINIKANFGIPVSVVFDGEVAYAERFLGYGNLIIIDHENGFYTLYGYLSDILVSKGEMVKKGETIGKVGSPSSTLESSLYFEIRENGKAIDPLKLLE
jgi:septal ring factor EnvC (AmiA/AmiB activator)